MVKLATGEEVCGVCNSPHNEYNPTEGFYTCLSCGAVWAYDEDDPDYDEDDYLPEKYKQLPEYKDENREIGGVFGFRHPETGETWDNYE